MFATITLNWDQVHWPVIIITIMVMQLILGAWTRDWRRYGNAALALGTVLLAGVVSVIF